MKRIFKILTVAFVFALIVSAFALASSAAVTGVTTKKADTFDNLVGNTASSGNPSGTKLAWAINNRWGTVTKETSPIDGNNYMVIQNADKVGANTPYFGSGYGGVGTTARPTLSDDTLNYSGSIEFYPYVVFDFDIMSPTGKLGNVYVGMQTRYMKSTGSIDATPHSLAANTVFIDSNDEGSYLYYGENIKKSINPYEFTHVTVVYEGVLTETSASYAAHVYVNDEYLYSIDSRDNSSYGYYGGIVHLTWDEVRVTYGTAATATDGRKTAFDNVVTRIISTDYNGNLAEIISTGANLTDWDANIYDSASMPAGIPVAMVGETTYTDMAAAIAAANGGTVTVINDIVPQITVDRPVTINAGSYNVNFVAGNGIGLTESGGVYTATDVKYFEYVSGGTTYYASSNMTLASVFAAADAGSTIKFLEDYASSATVTINKPITIDLNGKTFNATESDAKNNSPAFKVSTTAAAGFTLTSSVPGAKIFAGAGKAGGDPVITTAANDVVININGSNAQGDTTLYVYAPTIVQAWSNSCTVNIDGGEYYRTRSDNSGFIQLQGDYQLSCKNALIHGFNGNTFHLYGRYAKEGVISNAVIENCVIVGTGNVVSHSFENGKVLFKNCYISGNIKPDSVWTGDANKPAQTLGYVTLGEGNYINGVLSENVILADGLQEFEFSFSYDAVYKYNNYSTTDLVFDASSFDIITVTENLVFDRAISATAPQKIPVIWKNFDGSILGYSAAYPGERLTTPDHLNSFVHIEGWLNYIPNEWNEALVVPQGLNEYVLTAKEGGARKYVAAVDLRFDVCFLSHMKYNLYIPAAVEGITIDSVVLNEDRTSKYNSLINNVYMIDGKQYNSVDVWPGVYAAVKEHYNAGVVFTYEGEQFYTISTVNAVDYCEYVLGNNYTEDQKAVAANVANYLYTGMVALEYTAEAELVRPIVQNNTSRIFTPNESDIVIPDTTEIGKYISSVSIVIADYGPRFRFYLTEEGMNAKSILISTGFTAGTDTAAERKTAGYFETNNTDIQNIASTTITVTDSEGNKTSIVYTIENYIAMLSGVNEETVNFIRAMWGYAFAAKIVAPNA